MILEVLKAEYISDYKIKILFSNGETKTVDLYETIFNDLRQIFRPLHEIEYFRQFQLIFDTIGWENGLDLAPEYLYELKSVTELVIH